MRRGAGVKEAGSRPALYFTLTQNLPNTRGNKDFRSPILKGRDSYRVYKNIKA
jgi:hypothetical protein